MKKLTSTEQTNLSRHFLLNFHVPLIAQTEQESLGEVIDYITAHRVLSDRGVPAYYLNHLDQAVEIRMETRSWKEPRMYVFNKSMSLN